MIQILMWSPRPSKRLSVPQDQLVDRLSHFHPRRYCSQERIYKTLCSVHQCEVTDGHTLLEDITEGLSLGLFSFGDVQHSGPAHNVGQYLLVSLKSAQGRPYVSYGRGYNYVDECGEKPHGILKDHKQSSITTETLL